MAEELGDAAGKKRSGASVFAAGAALLVAGASVPGRECVAMVRRALAIADGAIALLGAPLCALLAGDDSLRAPVAEDVGCLAGGGLAGLVPALWLAAFTRWAAPPPIALLARLLLGLLRRRAG